jgi:hypothetical protein
MHWAVTKRRLLAWSAGLTISTAPGAAVAQWSNLGGALDPTLGTGPAGTYRASPQGDIIDIYGARNSDFTLMVNELAPTCFPRFGCYEAWSGWKTTNLWGPGSAVAWGNHREVFTTHDDGAVWHSWSDDNRTWWTLSLGSPPGASICGTPAAVSWAPGRIDVFAQGCDDAVYHIALDQPGWSPWDNTAGTKPAQYPILTSPSAVSASVGTLDAFFYDSNGEIFDVSWDGNRWNYVDTGACIAKGVPSAVTIGGVVALFGYDVGGNTMFGLERVNGAWTNIQEAYTSDGVAGLGPHPVADPASGGLSAAVFYANFPPGGAFGVSSWSYGGSSFSSRSQNLQSVFVTDPSPVAASSSIYVFGIGGDGSVLYSTQ